MSPYTPKHAYTHTLAKECKQALNLGSTQEAGAMADNDFADDLLTGAHKIADFVG
jgi:hypothetical protein